MAHIPTSYSARDLDREDLDAAQEALKIQYDMLGKIVGIPHMKFLPTQTDRFIAERIVKFMVDARGSIADTLAAENSLVQQFETKEDTDNTEIRLNLPRKVGAWEAEGGDAAKNWLDVMYENFGTAEMRKIREDLYARLTSDAQHIAQNLLASDAGARELMFALAMLRENPMIRFVITSDPDWDWDHEGAGSEACKKIIEGYLRSKGMIKEEYERVMQYLYKDIQRNATSSVDISGLSTAAFTVDSQESVVRRKRNESHSFRNLIGWRRNMHQEYVNQVFSEERLGVNTELNMNNERIPIMTLVNAYFHLKYLMKLPESDNRHLPATEFVVERMRRMHGALLERISASPEQAVVLFPETLEGTNDEEKHEFFMKLPLEERIHFIHSALQNPDNVNRYKGGAETMSKLALADFHESKESVEIWKKRLTGDTWIINPLGWPGKMIKNTATGILHSWQYSKPWIVDQAKKLPSRGAGVLVGAAPGFATANPLLLLAGAGVGWFAGPSVWKKLKDGNL